LRLEAFKAAGLEDPIEYQ